MRPQRVEGGALVGAWGEAPLASCLYEENRFRFFLARSCEGRVWKDWMFVPSYVVGNEMFFVRVNRFWCVWIRVPV